MVLLVRDLIIYKSVRCVCIFLLFRLLKLVSKCNRWVGLVSSNWGCATMDFHPHARSRRILLSVFRCVIEGFCRLVCQHLKIGLALDHRWPNRWPQWRRPIWKQRSTCELSFVASGSGKWQKNKSGRVGTPWLEFCWMQKERNKGVLTWLTCLFDFGGHGIHTHTHTRWMWSRLANSRHWILETEECKLLFPL